ncbi:hypothetical protein ACQWTT_001341 [Acinetobacter baumannii]
MNIYEHDETAVGALNPRWIPVLSGEIYCSPACGGKCKKAAYDKAVAESNEIAQILGEGWVPTVFENLGWHWKVEKGAIEVSLSTTGKYCSAMQFDLNQNFFFTAEDSDPREAVINVRNQLREVISKLERQHASSALDPIAIGQSV